jgi:RNA polymerase sigma-70 factor (ECF subfamily)
MRAADTGEVEDHASAAVVPIDFDGFFTEQRPRLYAALCLTTGDRQEAEELTQDAFVRVLERWPAVSGMQDPSGYLFVTAMNLFRKRYRRAKLAAWLPVGHQPADTAFDTIDDRDVLVRALRGLTPRQRAAVVLTSLLDLPTSEAARTLGIGESTVRALTTQARTQLRQTIGDGS